MGKTTMDVKLKPKLNKKKKLVGPIVNESYMADHTGLHSRLSGRETCKNSRAPLAFGSFKGMTED